MHIVGYRLAVQTGHATVDITTEPFPIGSTTACHLLISPILIGGTLLFTTALAEENIVDTVLVTNLGNAMLT